MGEKSQGSNKNIHNNMVETQWYAEKFLLLFQLAEKEDWHIEIKQMVDLPFFFFFLVWQLLFEVVSTNLDIFLSFLK